MRRQGYEFQVSKPEVLFKEIDGVKCEPIERLVADVPEEYAGAVIEKIGRRKGEMENMSGRGTRAPGVPGAGARACSATGRSS